MYSLSHPQKRIWYSEMLQSGNNMYNLTFTFRFDIPVDFILLERSINTVVRSNEGLRTAFGESDGTPYQYIRDYKPITIPLLDFTGDENREQEKIWIEKEVRRPFSFINSDLYRFFMLHFNDGECGFLINIHHIIADGWAIGLIAEYIKESYESLIAGKESPSLEKPGSLSYLQSESNYLSSKRFQQNKEFWKEKFLILPEPLNYPVLRDQHKVEEAGRFISYLSVESTQKIKLYCLQNNISLFTLFYTVLNIYLFRVTRQNKILIGTATHNRTGAAEKQTIGMFANLIPCLQNIHGDMSLSTILAQVNKDFVSLYRNQKYPYNKIIEDIRESHKIDQNLFQIVFTYENQPFKLRNCWHFNGVESFPLVIHLVEREGSEQPKFEIDYKTKVFKDEEIKSLYNSLINLLDDGMAHPGKSIDQLALLCPDERETLLYEFNKTQTNYPHDRNIIELFSRQAEKNPDHIALVFKDQQITYAQLDLYSNSLAREILQQGITPGGIIGILSNPSSESIIAILAVLKAGSAYLPIDPAYPKERINHMLTDSQAGMLILQKELSHHYHAIPKLYLKEFNDTKKNSSAIPVHSGPENPAYIIYTSGSTGLPKGVVIEQKSLINLCYWHKARFELTEKDNCTKYAGAGFDASVWEIFPALLSGSTLHIISPELRMDVYRLNKYYEDQNITVSFLPTALCEQFMQLENSSLRLLLTGGDRLSSFQKKSYELINNYGPTESTVVATSCPIQEETKGFPIGKPIANTQIYILDRNSNLLPLGIPGELCIGGDGLARGYLNRPELTTKRFIHHPYDPGKRIYKTGDLARWLPDGNIEFLGRTDFQIKIRGYRIEAGEIETVLLQNKQIQEAVVLALEDEKGGKILCAYLVVQKEYKEQDIRDFLNSRLPDYMIPAHFILMKTLPLTPEGKVDRKNLPLPQMKRDEEKNYNLPVSEKERILERVWCRIMGVNQIDIRDNFFSLGGDSIKAIQIATELRKEGFLMDIPDLYENPTIETLAKRVQTEIRIINQNAVEGEAPLLPIQKWFFRRNFTNPGYWNQCITLKSRKSLDRKGLKQVLTKILIHHDALRMVFPDTPTQMKQRNKGIDGLSVLLKECDLRNKREPENIRKDAMMKIHRSMDLKQGPLFQALLIHDDEGETLVLAAHHLVVDGISWRILLRDLTEGYNAFKKGDLISFQRKTDSYLNWAVELEKDARTRITEKEKQYWEVQNRAVNVGLPSFTINKNRVKKETSEIMQSLTEEETDALLKKSGQRYHTEINDLLLAALGLGFHSWCGLTVLKIKMEGHGREKIIPSCDITRTVGWFTTAYPVVLSLEHHADLSLYIRELKEHLRGIPFKGINYGLLDFPETGNEISFNYLGSFGENEMSDELILEKMELAVSPESTMPFLFDINGMIQNGRLQFNIAWNTKEFSRNSVSNLLDHFINSLKKIIQHCSGEGEATPTPSDFGDSDLSLKELERILEYKESRFGKENTINKIYPLTPLQEGMFLQFLRADQSQTYFEQIGFTVREELDIQYMENSFQNLIDRHDVLRTFFLQEGLRRPRQIVLNHCLNDIIQEDIRTLTDGQKSRFIKDFENQDRRRGFDITTDHLIRFAVIQLEEKVFRCILSFHHIIMDGWCLGILLKELFTSYNNYKTGTKSVLPSPSQFKSYINWLGNQNKEEAAEFWKNYLKGYKGTATLPGSMERNEKSNQTKLHEFSFDEKTTRNVNTFVQNQGVTLNTLFQALWGLLLQKYNRTDDVVFGTVVSGRPVDIENINTIIGLFINTVPLRVKSTENMTLIDLMKKINEDYCSSEKYSFHSLAEIQSSTGFHGCLFNHILAFENYPLDEEFRSLSGDNGSENLLRHIRVFEQTIYDLNIVILPGKRITVKLTYNGNHYSSQTMQVLEDHMRGILHFILDNGHAKMAEIDFILPDEKNRILNKFNTTGSNTPSHDTIHSLFEDQVKKTPHNTAVVYEKSHLSYSDLNSRANALAAVIRGDKGLTDYPVGILIHPSIEMIIALLAVLKAGGAFVPLDPLYPVERIQYILKDSGCTTLITGGKLGEKLNFSGQIINLDDFSYGEKSDLDSLNKPEDMAYIIYTSGSTGKPKGVVVEHRNLVNLVKWHNTYYEVTPKDRASKYASFGFDASVWEVFPYLLCGASLYIVNPEIKMDIEQLSNFFNNHKITVSFLPTLMCEQFLGRENPSLRLLLTGGDKLKTSMIPSFRLENNYGPTECTVVSTSFRVDKIYRNIPIGKAISHMQAYILDEHSRICPVFVPGELCMAGAGLARGYHNNPGLTAEKFKTFPDLPGKRLYRTGDLARWLPDGNIEFLGRIDEQVQIRGNRVEPGEIEAALMLHEHIKEAVVLAREDTNGHYYLGAYYVADREIGISVLREFMASTLPSFMIPSYFVHLTEMPVTPNGKIDKKALPEPEDTMDTGEIYIAPRNEREELINEIWQDVLGIEKIGINDNFFDLGGDSLKAIQVYSRLSQDYDISVNDIFENETIASLSLHIHNHVEDFQKKVNRMKVMSKVKDPSISLSFIMEKMDTYNHRNSRYFTTDLKEKNRYKHIFISGATGYLGIHVFKDLLINGEAVIHPLVRAKKTAEGLERIRDKMLFYFDEDIVQKYSERIVPHTGDLEQDQFGLPDNEYTQLTETLDCIINCAANVRHYGHYSDFEQVNVKGVSRLILLASEGRKKDLNHVSTMSVGAAGIKENNFYVFDEYEDDLGSEFDNLYIKTKLEAEKMIIQAREKGLNANIFRVGNLVFNSENGKFQENIQENAFYTSIRSYIRIGICPDIKHKTIDFSYIDFTSRAITLLFDRKELRNEIHHIINPFTISINKLGMLIQENNVPMEIKPFDQFLDFLYNNHRNPSVKEDIFNILLHSHIIENPHIVGLIQWNQKTAQILQRLDFNWLPPDRKMIQKMLGYCKRTGFI